MIRFNRLSLNEARAAIAPMVGNRKWDTSDGLCGVDDLIGGGVAFEAHDECGARCVFVVEQVQLEHGMQLEIRVARQYGAATDLTERMLPEVERYFGAGCKSVLIWTRRPGLMRKLQAAGYSQAAVIMKKEI